MFIIWGTKNIDKKVDNGIVVKKLCPKCRENRDLHEFKKEKYFSLFFLPIFPYGSEKSSFLKCLNCDTDYYLSPEDALLNDKSRLLEFDNRVIVMCPSCKTKLKIKPFDKDEVKIKCGNCKHLFFVKKNYKG